MYQAKVVLEQILLEKKKKNISRKIFNMEIAGIYYRMAGNFRGVLIFVIFVVDLAVAKISTHEN